MKKILLSIIMLLIFVLPVCAADFKEVDYGVLVNNKEVVFSAPVLVSSNRTMLPVRFVAQSLGIPDDDEHIIWDKINKVVTIKDNNNNVITLTVGSKVATVNGRTLEMDVEPFVNPEVNRTYVPLRFIAEAFDRNVYWDKQDTNIFIKDMDKYNSDKALMLSIMNNLGNDCKIDCNIAMDDGQNGDLQIIFNKNNGSDFVLKCHIPNIGESGQNYDLYINKDMYCAFDNDKKEWSAYSSSWLKLFFIMLAPERFATDEVAALISAEDMNSIKDSWIKVKDEMADALASCGWLESDNNGSIVYTFEHIKWSKDAENIEPIKVYIDSKEKVVTGLTSKYLSQEKQTSLDVKITNKDVEKIEIPKGGLAAYEKAKRDAESSSSESYFNLDDLISESLASLENVETVANEPINVE